MPTTLEAAQAVVARWLANWRQAGDAALTPTFLENEGGAEPSVPAVTPTTDAERIAASWVRLSLRNLTSTQDTLGAAPHRSFMRKAQVIAQIFTPPNVGIKVPLTLADTARAIYEGASFDGVHVYDVTVRELGTDGAWLQTNVEAAFTYYEQR